MRHLFLIYIYQQLFEMIERQSSSDESMQQPQQELEQILEPQHNENDRTQISMTNQQKQLLNLCRQRLTDLVIEYINYLYRQYEQSQIKFENFSKKGEYSHHQLENNYLKLHFLAKKILIKKKGILQINKYLLDNYSNGILQPYLEKIRPQYQKCILFKPNPSQRDDYFQIKTIKSDDYKEDSDYLVDKLFQFYLKSCESILYISSFIMLWAYKRGILTPKYLSQNALKVLIIAYLNLENVPNVIQKYRHIYKIELQNIKNSKEIGAKGKWEVNKKILQIHSKKFIVQYKKTFFIQKFQEQDFMPIIYTIDFPIIQKQVEKLTKQLKDQISSKINQKSIGVLIYHFFKYISTAFRQGQSIRLDIGHSINSKLYSKSKQIDSKTLTIIHPVYRHNLCQNLKKKEIFEVVQKQFNRALDILQQKTQKSFGKLVVDYST